MSTNINQGQHQGQQQNTNFAQRQFAQQRGELCKTHNLAAEVKKILTNKQCFNIEVEDPRALETESIDNYLQTGDEIFMGEIYSSSNESLGYKMQGDGLSARPDIPEDRNKLFSSKESAIDEVKMAMELLKCPSSYKKIGSFLIDSMDENGFISDPDSVYTAYLHNNAKAYGMTYHQYTTEILNKSDIETAHEYFKDNLKPAGILAKDHIDALRAKLIQTVDNSPVRDIALQLLTVHKEELKACLTKGPRNEYAIDKDQLGKIALLRRFATAGESLADMVYETLNDANKYFYEGNVSQAQTKSKKDVDFEVTLVNGNYKVEKLGIPKVFVNKEMMQEWERIAVQDKSTLSLVKNEYNSLEYVNNLLNSTKDVSEKIVTAILNEQKDAIETGDMNKLKVLRNIDLAEKFDVDQSVVSNIINDKVVRMPSGEEFTLKQFMERGVRGYEEGIETLVPKGQIRDIIFEKIYQENIQEPLTDKNLHEFFKEHGYKISQEMVSKLREETKIPDEKIRMKVYASNPDDPKSALFGENETEKERVRSISF